MSTEDSEKCCFGCTNVRNGARIIAILNICFLVFAIILNIIYIIIVFGAQYIYSPDTVRNEENTTQNMIALSTLLYVSCMELMFLYINFGLKKATHEKNVQNIKYWLVMYTILLVFTMIRFGFMAFISERSQFIILGFIYSFIILILLYVVKRFYHDELARSSTSDVNAISQSTSNDECLENQTV